LGRIIMKDFFKIQFLFICMMFFVFPAFAQFAEDQWDPGDNQLNTATQMSSPDIAEEIHGSHNLSENDPQDWFKFPLEQGVIYEFFATGEFDTSAELYAPDGSTKVAADDDNGPIINFSIRFKAEKSGDYYLLVRMYESYQDGTYDLHSVIRGGIEAPKDDWDPIDDTIDGAVVLDAPTAQGQDQPLHTLSDDDLYDWFAIDLSAAETYEFSSTGASDVAAELYLPNGETRLASDDDNGENKNFRLIFTPPEDGRYYIRIKMFESILFGSYILHVKSGVEPLPEGDSWDPPDDFVETSVKMGKPANYLNTQGPHTLSQIDRFDWFQFELTAGATYQFYSIGISNTIAELFLTDGITEVSADDDSGDGRNFSIIFTTQTDGTYYLRVRSFQNQDASYDLAYIQTSKPTPPFIDQWDPADDEFSEANVLGTPVLEIQTHGSHNLSLTDQEDWFVFDLKAGTDYEFRTSGSADTVGELFGADGSTGITQEDEGGSSYNFSMRFSPLTNGTYYLRVRMFDRGNRGTYLLHYSEYSSIPDSAITDAWDPGDNQISGATDLGALTDFEQQHGPHSLTNEDMEDWFMIQLAVGATYEIYSSGNSDTVATLYYAGASQPVIEQDDGGSGNNFLIRFSPDIAGTYYLKVSEFAGGNATYSIHLHGVPNLVSEQEPFKVFYIQAPEEYIPIPGGFTGMAPGSVSVGLLPANINEITDGKGATLSVAPGEVMLLQFPQVETGGGLILVRALVASNGPGASVALGALNGSLDGSIATNFPADSNVLFNRYEWMTLVYEAPADTVIPVFQLANTQGEQAVDLYLDNIEIYQIPKGVSIPSWLLGASASQEAAPSFPPLPAQTFNLLSAGEYNEQPGGFLQSPAGSVSVGDIPVPESIISDGIGATLDVAAGEVELLLFPTIETEDDLVLIRARIKSSGSGASIAVVGVDGSFDGSLASHIDMDSGLYENNYQWLTFTYYPPSGTVAPIVQLAGGAETSGVSVYLDTLEVYRFPKNCPIPTVLLYTE
jgi:pre-peptidase